MPRRGGKDSVRPNDPKMRAVAAIMRGNPRAPVVIPVRLNPAPDYRYSVVNCTHDVDWQICTICSKPVQR